MPRVGERTSPVIKRGICASLPPEEGRHEPLEMQTAFDQAWAACNGRHDVMTFGEVAVMVHRAGAGRPLVCIHGWAMGGLSFAAQLALIDQGFEIIAPDLPGFGDSPVAEVHPTIDTMADLVGELINGLDLSDVTLVGWSMGASVAWHLAATGPARVKALASIDMSPRVAPEDGWDFSLSTSMTRETIELAVHAMRNDWTGYCDLFLDRILAQPDKAIRTAMATLAAQADPVAASQAWLSLMQFDARADLAHIQVPALAIHGGRSVLYPQTVGHEIARLMPQCRAIVLDNVGHAPHLEAPAAFNAHLRALAMRPPPALTLCQHITAQ